MKHLRVSITLFFLSSLTLNAETLALAGDSTVATYSSGEKQGWGASFSKFVSTKLKVSNFAKGGRTTKTFRSEGHWKKLLAAQPQFIFVQFGHNDSSKAAKGVPVSQYKGYLQNFIDEADAKNAEIYFVTPPRRCRFSNGKVSDDMKDYVAAMKSVAAANGIVVLDLYKKSAELLNAMGTKACKEYYVKSDSTHFNKKGSEKMASLVATEAKLDELLGKFLK